MIAKEAAAPAKIKDNPVQGETELQIIGYTEREMHAFLWECEVKGLLSYYDAVSITKALKQQSGYLVLRIKSGKLISFRIEQTLLN